MMTGLFVLVLYAYSENEESRENLEYFVDNGLLPADAGHHVFILNGANTVNSLLREKNVDILQRENTCMDFGAWGIAIQSVQLKRYSHIILMNSSVRGPFLPMYSQLKWWEIFIRQLGGSHHVGLVGTSLNCWTSLKETHLQSMLLVTNRSLFEQILVRDKPHLLACKHNHSHAVFQGEIPLSQAFIQHNYALKTMLLAFQATIPSGGIITPDAINRPDLPSGTALYTICRKLLSSNTHAGDLYYPNEYSSTDIHPLETIFFKTSRQVAPKFLEAYTSFSKKTTTCNAPSPTGSMAHQRC